MKKLIFSLAALLAIGATGCSTASTGSSTEAPPPASSGDNSTPDVPSSTAFAVGDCVAPGGSSTQLTVINCAQASGGDLKIVKILKGEFRSNDCPSVGITISGTAGYDDVAPGKTLCMVFK